jgi:hypothetical protein
MAAADESAGSLLDARSSGIRLEAPASPARAAQTTRLYDHVADLSGGSSPFVELAVQNQASAHPRADPHPEEVSIRTSGTPAVLAENRGLNVVVNRDLHTAHCLREEGAQLHPVIESGNIRCERYRSGCDVDLAWRADSDAA